MREPSVENVVKTACQACHCECGVLVHVKEGKVTKIEGDPEHPFSRGFICVKGLASPQLLYHQDRLKYPLKRVGEKGEGKWQRISWDEALDTIATGLEEVKREYGPLAISTSIGTGPRGYENAVLHFSHVLGCNSMWATHMCYIPTFIIGRITCGAEITQERGPDYEHTNCMVIWGANPLVSHPPRGQDILKARKRGAKLIVIDPRRTELAAKADVWLQLRPGTDAALALGMMNVIINEELYDKEFVDKWCFGFEELRKRVQEYPPERVAEITWVPEEQFKKAARLYATTKPAVLHHRVAVEHQMNSSQNLRCLYILIALTGNIDVKGGNLIPLYPSGFIPSYLKDVEPPGRQVSRLGDEQFPLYAGLDNPLYPISHNPTVIKAMLTGKPYPVKALLTFNNLVINCENSKQAWEALRRLQFMVAVDFFMTPTAELADIVLPTAHWLEKDEVCYMSYNNFITVRQKAVEPSYECWDDKKIIFELAKRMNLDKWFPWKTVEEFNGYVLGAMGITFDNLKEKAYITGPIKYKKYEVAGLRTPSKKVELYSYLLEKHGYDPLPAYKEYPESFVRSPGLAKEYPLILITGGRQISFFHSEGRQIPKLRRLCPEPLIEIHPETAKGLGINDGDWVWIETPRGEGRVKQKAKLSPDIHPRVCHAQHHWWFPEKPAPEHGCWESNINLLTSNDLPYDPVVGSTVLRGLQCKIYKV